MNREPIGDGTSFSVHSPTFKERAAKLEASCRMTPTPERIVLRIQSSSEKVNAGVVETLRQAGYVWSVQKKSRERSLYVLDVAMNSSSGPSEPQPTGGPNHYEATGEQ